MYCAAVHPPENLLYGIFGSRSTAYARVMKSSVKARNHVVRTSFSTLARKHDRKSSGTKKHLVCCVADRVPPGSPNICSRFYSTQTSGFSGNSLCWSLLVSKASTHRAFWYLKYCHTVVGLASVAYECAYEVKGTFAAAKWFLVSFCFEINNSHAYFSVVLTDI